MTTLLAANRSLLCSASESSWPVNTTIESAVKEQRVCLPTGCRGGYFDVVRLQQVDDALPLDVVVFDDQESFGSRGDECLHSIEGTLQVSGGRGFDEIGKC